MAGACPAPGVDDPLVRSLLGVVDCNVRELVHGGYASIFQPNGALTGVLTVMLTLYVAFIGYRLLLGRGQLSVGDFALTAVKLGAVLALATQWDTYQAVVYRTMFDGPQQLAGSMLVAVQPDGSAFHGDVFDGLQLAFDEMSKFGGAYAGRSPPTVSPFLGGAGFAAFLLNSSGAVLLLSTLGVLLASKVVLGLLLATGPIFIALFLFDATRGVFEGWLRAGLAFALAPLATTLLLGVALIMLEPSLGQLDTLQKQGAFPLAPVYSIIILVLVFAGVAAASLIAVGTIAAGFRLPVPQPAPVPAQGRETVRDRLTAAAPQPRAARVAAAATALDRRDSRTAIATLATSTIDRRSTVVQAAQRAGSASAAGEPTRLGQQRRTTRPRSQRPNARTAPLTAPRTAP